jgi:hypothetical protein
MTEKKKPSKIGRPKIKVDAALVEKLAGIGCPNKEIAAIVGCSVDTLDRRCADIIIKGRENGKTRIRQKQIQMALGGNVAMLIFLGKNMLGQTDKQEITGIENASTVNILLGQQQEEQLAQLVSMAQASATKPPAPARLIEV